LHYHQTADYEFRKWHITSFDFARHIQMIAAHLRASLGRESQAFPDTAISI